ncbi:MUTYH [Branchiostoma lanceolatum]|uniref:Adenine DNA glycosylase n=1 Tax=Branchiostoma lanceolatum TaxID=7740 RepID=A0A8J9YXA9_BRALA|nr:MUTYH [Branchiostoma lanceolatum]
MVKPRRKASQAAKKTAEKEVTPVLLVLAGEMYYGLLSFILSLNKFVLLLTVTCGLHQLSDDDDIPTLRSNLLSWYDINKRDLPWRQQLKNPDVNQRAYAVWVSEMMLQQTQVATVIDYYNRWMEKWPTVQKLATASLEEVNEMWSGLGYYSRGRRLHEGAQKVVKELDGQMPSTAASLLKELPGVGRYTAGAIASISYSQVTGVVDGNVIRVLSRLRVIGAESTSPQVTEVMWSLADHLVDSERPGDFNQAMMELGATVCTPKNPSCGECPVRGLCRAYQQVETEKKKSANKLENMLTKKVEPPCSVQDIEDVVKGCSFCLPKEEPWDSSLGVMNYPRKAKKKPPREEKTAVAIVSCAAGSETKFLIVQRPETGLLAGLWEFPSVQLDSQSETRKSLIDSYLKETIGLTFGDVERRTHVGEVVHIFSHIHQTYMVETFDVECDGQDGGMGKQEAPPCRWVTRSELQGAALSTTMRKVFKAYEASKSRSQHPAIGNSTGAKVSNKRKRKSSSDNGDKKKQMALDSFFKPRGVKTKA